MHLAIGVIPKNENRTDEMTSILQQLHKYIPLDQTGKHINIVLGGDQLTVERARVCQELRKHSIESTEQLGGLTPFAANWCICCKRVACSYTLAANATSLYYLATLWQQMQHHSITCKSYTLAGNRVMLHALYYVKHS